MVKRKQSPPRLPLDFTKLIASRRANRVAAYKHMEGNNDHFYNIQHAVAVENDFNERQRVAEKLRLGAVPAHVTHRVVDALVVRAQGIAAVNMEADRQAKIKAAAEAAKEAAKEAAAKAAKAAKAAEAKDAASSSSSGSSESEEELYYPSSIKHDAYAKKSSMPFDSVVKKALSDGEQQVRHNLVTARAFPDAVKSGNAKLRAIYE
jgi:hypothetical protein